jgi:hypothetical protein
MARSRAQNFTQKIWAAGRGVFQVRTAGSTTVSCNLLSYYYVYKCCDNIPHLAFTVTCPKVVEASLTCHENTSTPFYVL